MNWAILSGVEGNLAAYKAVLHDWQRQHLPIDEIYILGDVIHPAANNTQVVQALHTHLYEGIQPQICQGWWEEQALILHGLGRTSEPNELLQRYGADGVKQLWDVVPRSLINWIRTLDFGFFELDCLLIHGSTVSVSDELTPTTSPIHLLDRLLRMEARTLFCGRSGLTFDCQIYPSSVASNLITLDHPPASQTTHLDPRKIVGVGSVGRIPGKATYTLYSPTNQTVTFKTVHYGTGKGFQKQVPSTLFADRMNNLV
jgi:hypothetical protein